MPGEWCNISLGGKRERLARIAEALFRSLVPIQFSSPLILGGGLRRLSSNKRKVITKAEGLVSVSLYAFYVRYLHGGECVHEWMAMKAKESEEVFQVNPSKCVPYYRGQVANCSAHEKNVFHSIREWGKEGKKAVSPPPPSSI